MMETVKHDLSDITVNYPLSKISAPENMLFVDIETTGLTPRTSRLYLIGCAYFSEGMWHTLQFFGNEYSDEEELISEFDHFARNYKYLIHFNGNTFDIPYLNAKAKEYGIDAYFKDMEGIDIYRRISGFKTFLKLENCKQKSIEQFLGINREDKYSGGDLIKVYGDYVLSKNESLKEVLLLHNYEDVRGMLEILPILSYVDLFSEKHTVTKVSANYYKDYNGEDKSELLMEFELATPLPTPVSFIYDQCYFTGTDKTGMIKVPMYEEELKYFYANYKDYYYLPAEDIALHKSVSSFVEKSHREQAKANNCYTRKISKYLPEWSDLVTPFFKRDYQSKEMFFELTDERRTDRALFSDYVSHILDHMAM